MSAAFEAQHKAQLGVRFPGLGEDAIVEALSILRVYGLTVSDLFFKWEAFVLASTKPGSASMSASAAAKKEEQLELSLDNLRELRKEIAASLTSGNINVKREQTRDGADSSAGTPLGTANSRVKKLGGRAALDGILDGLPGTPIMRKKPAITSTPAPLSAFKPSSFGSTSAMRPSSSAVSATPDSKPQRAQGPGNGSSHIHGSDVGGGSVQAGPSRPPQFDSPSASIPAVRFEERPNPREIVETLNSDLPSLVGYASSSPMSRVALTSNVDPRQYNYRYMFEKISERATVMDAAIDDAAELIKAYYDIEDLGNPDLVSQEDMYCVGRICAEGDGVRMTDTSIFFESSRLLGSGGRIQLRFDPEIIVRTSDDGSFSLGEGGAGFFPGMITGIKGRNAGGGYFAVTEILMMPPTDQPETTVPELIEFQHGPAKLDGKPMSVITACGPYTLDNDLDYAPMTALIEEISSTRPDVVILLGPFVDAQHSLIKTGDVDETANQLFNRCIASKLGSFLDYSPNTTVILIPSPRDMTSQHTAYPQAPMDRDGLELHKRIKILPNPAAFSVNEIAFAVTSIDTLFALKQSEYFKKCKEADAAAASQDSQVGLSKDPMARICRYILRQRSFYPIFPAPMAAPLDPLNLDVTHADLLRFGTSAGADIFILPSMLKHFAKVVDSAIIVNPGSLCRKNAAGTYTKFTVYPTPRAELRAGVQAMTVDGDSGVQAREHRIYERCRVDIIRI